MAKIVDLDNHNFTRKMVVFLLVLPVGVDFFTNSYLSLLTLCFLAFFEGKMISAYLSALIPQGFPNIAISS